MPGQSTTGDVVKTGKLFAAQSHANQQRGPGNKNLGPSAKRQANPQGTIRSTGQQVKGPDKGAGSS